MLTRHDKTRHDTILQSWSQNGNKDLETEENGLTRTGSIAKYTVLPTCFHRRIIALLIIISLVPSTNGSPCIKHTGWVAKTHSLSSEGPRSKFWHDIGPLIEAIQGSPPSQYRRMLNTRLLLFLYKGAAVLKITAYIENMRTKERI
jgi:hypothetical protein